MTRPDIALALAVLGAGFATGAEAAVRTFSYDAANDLTRRTAGGLTFDFTQRLVFTRVLRVRATEGHATADLRPASETALGRGGLSAIIGPDARERDLYEIDPRAEGADMIHAFCPGSSHGWLAFGHVAPYRDLRVRVLGDDPKGGAARVCETLDFSWRGEWRMPSGQSPRARDMLEPTFPY
jgi:hypothetical protein